MEILYDGPWGAVCDHLWGLSAVQVVSRHLGCSPALAVLRGRLFGGSLGPIFLDTVQCTGMGRGRHLALSVHNYRHHEEAGAICSGPELSLSPASPPKQQSWTCQEANPKSLGLPGHENSWPHLPGIFPIVALEVPCPGNPLRSR